MVRSEISSPSRAARLVHLGAGVVMAVILTLLARVFDWSGETLGWAALGGVAVIAGPGTAVLFRYAERRR